MKKEDQTPQALRKEREAIGISMKFAATESLTPYRTWQSWEDEGPGGRRPKGIAFAWLRLYKLGRK